MSQQLINRSADLKRLRDEGYDVNMVGSHLVVGHVPYVNQKKEVCFGTLVTEVTMAADAVVQPANHVVSFAGEYPCDEHGAPLEKIRHTTSTRTLDQGLVVHHAFSSKPKEPYPDYYEKMTTYVAILGSPAHLLDPDATARTYPVIETAEAESVFQYEDTASSRAEITVVTRKLELERIGIIGVGGTGSYVLDFVSKTPVKEIHIFDGDKFLNHNAFRSPGAPSLEELRRQPSKVEYFKAQYGKMHRHIHAHDCYVELSNVDQLRGMTFVFLCLDGGEAKRLIVKKLEEYQVPFVDAGLGINVVDEKLAGLIRVTTSTVENREHVRERSRIPFSDGGENNEYARNIQVADLNGLNAALAVIKWKKLFGFYADLEREHHSTYAIDGNNLTNEDQ